nr:MAG TPA: hypothetical protein [Caudoviricetes sp.]
MPQTTLEVAGARFKSQFQKCFLSFKNGRSGR